MEEASAPAEEKAPEETAETVAADAYEVQEAEVIPATEEAEEAAAGDVPDPVAAEGEASAEAEVAEETAEGNGTAVEVEEEPIAAAEEAEPEAAQAGESAADAEMEQSAPAEADANNAEGVTETAQEAEMAEADEVAPEEAAADAEQAPEPIADGAADDKAEDDAGGRSSSEESSFSMPPARRIDAEDGAAADAESGGRPRSQGAASTAGKETREALPEQEVMQGCRGPTVDFSRKRLTKEGLQTIVAAIRKDASQLLVLKLHHNNLDDSAAEELSQLFQACPGLEELHLSHNKFTAQGVKDVVKAADQELRTGQRPFWLRFEHNDIEDGEALAEELERRFQDSVCCAPQGNCANWKACHARYCQYGRRIHIPFLRERGSRGGKGGGSGWNERRTWKDGHDRSRSRRKDADWQTGRTRTAWAEDDRPRARAAENHWDRGHYGSSKNGRSTAPDAHWAQPYREERGAPVSRYERGPKRGGDREDDRRWQRQDARLADYAEADRRRTWDSQPDWNEDEKLRARWMEEDAKKASNGGPRRPRYAEERASDFGYEREPRRPRMDYAGAPPRRATTVDSSDYPARREMRAFERSRSMEGRRRDPAGSRREYYDVGEDEPRQRQPRRERESGRPKPRDPGGYTVPSRQSGEGARYTSARTTTAAAAPRQREDRLRDERRCPRSENRQYRDDPRERYADEGDASDEYEYVTETESEDYIEDMRRAAAAEVAKNFTPATASRVTTASTRAAGAPAATSRSTAGGKSGRGVAAAPRPAKMAVRDRPAATRGGTKAAAAARGGAQKARGR
mmetsp:Transcript_20190/g.47072  ORF Transcript_20190/g.47072 Transcript_20190/m.47072 type:complete len:800 (+) Transcript_20190:107-2506(+)